MAISRVEVVVLGLVAEQPLYGYQLLERFGDRGGDPAQFWAQGRMKGFRLAIQKAIPGAKFVEP